MDNYIVVGDPELAPDVPPTSVDASEVSYNSETVEDALDRLDAEKVTLVDFSDLSKYGIATSGEKINTTLEEICKKIPSWCEVKIHWTGNQQTDGVYRFGTLGAQMPETYGALYIHKTAGRNPCIIEFIPYDSGNHYSRNYDYMNSANHLSDWVNLGRVSSIDTTKQIANGLIASWSSAQSLSTGYVRYNYGQTTNYNGGVAISSLHKGILYKVTVTGTCSNVVNDIEMALVLKTANTLDVDTDSVAWAFGKTQISGTSFAIETYISIPKNVSPTYCQYWFRKSSSSTSPTVNRINANWEEIGVYDAIKIGDDNIQSRISNVETKGLSSQAYSTGQYFTHGDKLKKVTSAIASGDTISSSNTEDTTVGAELAQINSNLSSSYQTIYNDSGRFIRLYRYGKLRMLYIQHVMATTSIHSLIPASDMPLGGSIRGTLLCSHDSSYTVGDLYINSSHTDWLTDVGPVSSSSYTFYGQILWVVS